MVPYSNGAYVENSPTTNDAPVKADRTNVDLMTPQMLVVDCGLQQYSTTVALQRTLVEARVQSLVPDILIIVEHHPVITLGKRADRQSIKAAPDVLRDKGIEVFTVERGGGATFHSPGQLVLYPIFLLSRGGRNVKAFVGALEQVMIDVLNRYGIDASQKPGYPGVWLGASKIGAVGIAICHGVSFHGCALNINNDLSGFDLIYPCGMREGRVTSAQQYLGKKLPFASMKKATIETCSQIFNKPDVHVMQWDMDKRSTDHLSGKNLLQFFQEQGMSSLQAERREL